MRRLVATSLAAVWHRWHPSAFRSGSWYLLGAISLTVLWLATVGLAPDAGLTRSYWYPGDAATEPIIEEHVTAVDLAFIDEGNRPTRNYRVRWHGVWFSPRAERVDFHAGADDGVILRVDGETILERNPAVGMHTVARTVELAAGAHRLEIDHWQDGGARSLDLQWAPAGDPPALLSPARLFAENPDALGYWLRIAAMRLPVLVLLVWATGVVLLVGLTVWRAFYRRVTSLSPDERWRRLRTVLFPALLGPSQLLLFGPWTVHDTNRTEFLVGFWELAPGWVWLLGPIVGVLAGLSIVMPARWFPRYVAALCAVGVLLWTQGNLLLADYGLLDGGGLDLASHAWRTPFEAGLWVCVLLLAVVFADRVARVAPVACVALVTLQATVLLVPVGRVATLDAPPTTATETAWRLPPPEIYELSSTRNLIHIVLDTFPTHTFADILDADRPAFDRDWPGFTFFANHLGTHRNTFLSMPAMLSGVAFRNEMPFRDFRRSASIHIPRARTAGVSLRSMASRRYNYLNPSFLRGRRRDPVTTSRRPTAATVTMSMSRRRNCSTYRCFGTRRMPSSPTSTTTGVGSSNSGSRRDGGRRRQRRSPLEKPRFCVSLPTGITRGRRRTRLHAAARDDTAPPGSDGRGLRVRAQAGAHPGRLREPGDGAPCQPSGRCSSDCETSTSTTGAPSSSRPTMESTWPYIEPEDEHPLRGIRSPAGMTLPRIESYGPRLCSW